MTPQATPSPATLHILGAGRVGRTLGRLWREAGTFRIGEVANSSLASSEAAVAFIGAGRALDSALALDVLRPGDCLLISADDDAIPALAARLGEAGGFGRDNVVFHCSGALTSDVLAPLERRGARVASVHPMKSFADAAAACESFAGTPCGSEGDDEALARLRPAFAAIGGKLFGIDGRRKPLYHAAAVLACNDLVALIEAGLLCLERAGLPRETAVEVLGPLVSGTLDNVMRSGTRAALTGPVARGNVAVVASQLDALDEWRSDLARVYRSLGQLTAELAEARGGTSPDSLVALRALFARDPSRDDERE